MLEASFGDMTLSSSEWMEQTMNASAELMLSVGDLVMLYAPQALIMGALAFLVYKKLAERNGNWERICGFFRKQPQQKIDAEELTVSLEAEPKKKLITVPLILAIVIGIAFMIFYEIMTRMA